MDGWMGLRKTAVLPGVSIRLDEVLNHRSNPIEGLARLAIVDGGLPAVVCHLDELLSLLVDLPH